MLLQTCSLLMACLLVRKPFSDAYEADHKTKDGRSTFPRSVGEFTAVNSHNVRHFDTANYLRFEASQTIPHIKHWGGFATHSAGLQRGREPR